MKNAWRSLGVRAVVIFLLTLLAYIPAMRNGFVFDDHMLITDCPLVKDRDGLRRIWLTTEAPYCYPLSWSLWWLEWRSWGDGATGYHVVNIVLHALNAVLVWLVLRRLKIPGAWLGGLVFAVHPVNVATVAWISEQKNTLSMLFYATAILLYLRFDEVRQWRWYTLSLVAFLLGLFSKTAVVMLPVVLLLCIWWLHRRVRWKDFLYSAPFFVFSLISGLLTIWFERRALEEYTVLTNGYYRMAVAGWAPWFYLYKALLPLNLTVVYPQWQIDASRCISFVPGMVLIGCLALFWWKREAWGRPLLFGLGYFVAALFPVLGFFDHAFYFYSWVADHWQYYSIVAVIALAVAAGELVCCRLSKPNRYWGSVTAMVVLAVLAGATWKRSYVYANDETLWRDNLARNPNAFSAYNGLGAALAKQGRWTEAIELYEMSLRIRPDYAEAHNNLGVALGHAGRIPEAIEHYQQALRVKPNLAEGHDNLGIVLGQSGRVTEAIEQFEQALRIRPDYADAHNNLAIALAQMGRPDEAFEHWRQALRFNPALAEAHYNLGIALEKADNRREAIEHYQQALKINPDYAEAKNRLAQLRTIQ